MAQNDFFIAWMGREQTFVERHERALFAAGKSDQNLKLVRFWFDFTMP